MTLQPGDTIKCAGNSRAEITLFDGSIVEIFPDTELKIADLSSSGTGTTSIKMQQQIGKTVSRVKKLTDTASRYEIETPAAVASVRGSTMTVIVYPDGSTVVTNEAGDIRVTAQGKEVIIPIGYKVTIKPGEAPGNPVPIVEPTTSTPTPTPTPTYSGGGGGSPATTTPVYTATITTTVETDRFQAYAGQTVVYTYKISNTGNMQLYNVSVSDNVNGAPAYQSGNTNADNYLDPGERWVFTSSHVISVNDPTPLLSTARFSATASTSITLAAEDHVSVAVLPSSLTIKITSPANGAIADAASVNISGTVNDISLTGGTATVNGNSRSISISEGSFSFGANINAGQNIISVNATNGIGISANDSITLTKSAPAISMVNTASTARAVVGNIITYNYKVSNTGNVPLSNLLLTNSVTITGNITYQSGDTNGNGAFDPGEQWSYIANHTAVDADIVVLVNTAVAEGTYGGTGQKVNASAPASVIVIGNYGIKIELTWDTAGTNVDAHLIRPGGVINHPVNDCYYGNQHPDWGTQGSILGDPYLDYDDTDGYGPETIYISEPFESGVYKYAVHYRSDNGHGATKATVSVWYYGTKVETWEKTLVNGEIWYCINFDWALSNFIAETPFILIDKAASTATAYAGDNITYTYYVGNFGNISVSNVTVTDDKIQTAAVYKSGDANSNGLLDVGEIWAFSAIYTVTGADTSPLTNIATAQASVQATGVQVTCRATTSVIINSR
jgi:uncharacterized repeat protein (TIGR01451 family)